MPAFDIQPSGMLALDVARIEAGLLLIDVDFNSSKKALGLSREQASSGGPVKFSLVRAWLKVWKPPPRLLN